MLVKVAEVMPKWIEIKFVVGVKYIKMLEKNLDPKEIETTCAEKIKALNLNSKSNRRSPRKPANVIKEERRNLWKEYLKEERIDG